MRLFLWKGAFSVGAITAIILSKTALTLKSYSICYSIFGNGATTQIQPAKIRC